MVMIIKKKVRKEKNAFSRYKMSWLFVFCAVLFLGFFFAPDSQRDYRRTKVYVDPYVVHTSELKKENAPLKRERPLYPYSVIPRGVRNRGELAAKIAEDPLVADHYADFNISETKIFQTKEDSYMYVSYRLNNKIYWTAKKIKIPQGEPLITDGRCEIRARCGNRISASPLMPISGEEPILESLDMPEITPEPPEMALESPIFEPKAFDDRISLALAMPPPMIESSAPFLDITPSVISTEKSSWQWPYHYRPLVILGTQAVPEPGSSSLLFLGMIAFVVYRFVQNR
jgi:hypothetical protein